MEEELSEIDQVLERFAEAHRPWIEQDLARQDQVNKALKEMTEPAIFNGPPFRWFALEGVIPYIKKPVSVESLLDKFSMPQESPESPAAQTSAPSTPAPDNTH